MIRLSLLHLRCHSQCIINIVRKNHLHVVFSTLDVFSITLFFLKTHTQQHIACYFNVFMHEYDVNLAPYNLLQSTANLIVSGLSINRLESGRGRQFGRQQLRGGPFDGRRAGVPALSTCRRLSLLISGSILQTGSSACACVHCDIGWRTLVGAPHK